MKRLKGVVCLIFIFSFVGCFEIEEKVDIKSNGTGELTVNTDMSQVLSMMESMLGKEEMDKQLPRKSVDTTVMMKDFVDTSKNISAENKALFRQGKMHLKLNMDEKIFKANMNFPFTSLNNLQKLYTAMNDGSLNTAGMFRDLTSGKAAGMDDSTDGTPDMNQYNSIYTFTVKDGTISRKLDPAKWKSLQESPQFAQLKQTSTMGIQMPYTLVVTLPRPVKKIDNSLATLSNDKKTVIIKYNLTDVFDNPEKFEYTIAY
jgi:hypothetical protein